MKGFSLIELCVAMAVAAVLAAAAAPVVVRSVEIKAGEKTALEIAHLQDLARKFYAEHDRAWPQSFNELRQAGYMNPQWNGRNPWGSDYLIADAAGLLSVSTDVPQNMTGLVSMRVPMASVSGKTVTSTVGIYAGTGDSFEPGIIVAWSGTIASIPSGWALCDGTNGTPDLRDRFIVGARQDDEGTPKTAVMGPLSVTGGTISHRHGGSAGSHVLTVAEMPAHSHTIAHDGWSRLDNGGRYTGAVSEYNTYPPGYSNTSAVGGSQGHTHTIASDHNVPPYYALAFIMKLP